MFCKNRQKQVLKELATQQLSSHRSRNLVMVIAIALTALLLSFVFTAGLSFIATMRESSEAAPGPYEDGAVMGTPAHYEKIVQMENVEWADLVLSCSSSSLKNDEFAGIQTELLAPDEGYYCHNKIIPVSGTYPQEPNDIMISDTLAERLGIENAGGQLLLYVVVTSDNGNKEETAVPMEICGVYGNPIKNLSSIYEEIYTAPGFIQWKNPCLEAGRDYIYIKLNDLNPFALKSDVYSKLEQIRQDVGANYVQTRHYNNFFYSLSTVIPVILLALLIVVSGYFLIYNVFSISITMDVEWFGMMKTIGATQKQMIYIYRRQIWILSLVGMFAGICFGYLLGLVLSPRILAMTSFSMYFKGANAAAVAVFTFLFTMVTLRIGSSGIIRKAASLSPVDAARYVPHKRKKLVTILSVSLSGIIFVAVGNAVFGYNVDTEVERHNQEECRILHYANFMALEDEYQPILYETCEQVRALPFVQDVDVIYKARTMPDEMDIAGMELYYGFYAQIRQSGALKREVDAILATSGGADTLYFADNGDVKLEVSGIGADRLERESEYFHVIEGEVDSTLFAQGDYILYQSPSYTYIMETIEESNKVHAGDILTIDFYDDAMAGYVTKTFTVMAVIEGNDPYAAGNLSLSNIIMNDDIFKEIYPDYESHIAAMEVRSQRPLDESEIKQVRAIIQKEHNSQIGIETRSEDRIYYTQEKNSVLIIGLFFSSVLGLIGISNLVNTIVMDVVFRKSQIAMLQSIGMTRKQLCRMLFKDSIRLGSIAMVTILTVGWFMAVNVSSLFTGFDFRVYVWESIGIVVFFVAAAGILAVWMTEWLNKKTIVERLRNE